MKDPTGVIQAVLCTADVSPIAMLKPAQAAVVVGCEPADLGRCAKAYDIAGHTRYRLCELAEVLCVQHAPCGP